jgi:[ribosomal protein S18]-alanine N-acetyltransferase
MNTTDLDRVAAIERGAYAFPWSRGNFVDSLAAGYLAEVLADGATGEVVGYFVAMIGVGEMHLLNLTVAPEAQGQGHGHGILQRLMQRCRQHRLESLWLEVRFGNHRARALYRRHGFAEVGLRRGYYPAPFGAREDAVIMSLALPEPGDGLD